MINNHNITIDKSIIIIAWDTNKNTTTQIIFDNNSNTIKASCLKENVDIFDYSTTIEDFNKLSTPNNQSSIEEELCYQTFKILESFNKNSSHENNRLLFKVKPSLVSITNFFTINNTKYTINSAILPSANPTQNTIINLLFELDNNKIPICNKYYGTNDYNEPQELITQNSKIKTFEKYDPIYDPIVDHYFNETLKMNNSFATIENSYNR